MIHFGCKGKKSTNFGIEPAILEKFRKQLEKAPLHSIVPIYKTVQFEDCPIEFFSKISDKGRKENCILLESADVMKRYGEKSIGSSEPCLKVAGQKEKFEITALNRLGQSLLKGLGDKLGFCDSMQVKKNSIEGKLKPKTGVISEQARLKTRTHADILREIAFGFKPFGKSFAVSSGLFGAISYDFIDQFEQLPKNKTDLLKDPDYEMLFLDNLFLVDHKKKKMTLIANAFKAENNTKKELQRCVKKIELYEENLAAPNKKHENRKAGKKINVRKTSDCSKQEFISIVKKCKEHILLGNVFQIVPSITTIVETRASPLKIYKALRNLNPSPYMFFMHSKSGTLLGSSPETFIKVEGNGKKRVEIRPIAGTKPRGITNGKIDLDLDSRFENELKSDEKELAEHTMLVDLARNDVARVSEPGSRIVDSVHNVERYSHVMHLVSNVSGKLKPGLDALHAYLASMNMGTLTGAPKVKAMELLREFEKTKRGFYGGSIGYLTPDGNFDSAIVIRSMKIKGTKAYVRAGAGIVFDSIPEKEFEETENKAKACLKAIQAAEEPK